MKIFTGSNLIIFSSIFLGIVLEVSEGQMIPISEVKTHTPSPSPKESANRKPMGRKPTDDVHVKIAAAHLAEENEADEENTEEGAGTAKVFQKDKPTEFQDPSKHESEGALLNFFIERYMKNSRHSGEAIIAEQVDILQNLENFSHKFENGRDLFAGTNALSDVLLPALNSSSSEIRRASCMVFAVAAQNNLAVQKLSFKAGATRALIRILGSDVPLVSDKALYALSTLLRNFPAAQQKFIQDGGIKAAVQLAERTGLTKRSLTMVSDLIRERKHCDDSPKTKSYEEEEIETSDDPCDRAGLLVTALKTSGWCNLLESIVKNVDTLGVTEQIIVIDAVHSSLDICSREITNSLHYIQKLLATFEPDEDFEEVKSALHIILNKFDYKLNRTEL